MIFNTDKLNNFDESYVLNVHGALINTGTIDCVICFNMPTMREKEIDTLPVANLKSTTSGIGRLKHSIFIQITPLRK